MAKVLMAVLALAAFGTAGHTDPAAGSHQAAAAQPHKYWLSEDLNRLAFWETPSQANTKTQSKARASHVR